MTPEELAEIERKWLDSGDRPLSGDDTASLIAELKRCQADNETLLMKLRAANSQLAETWPKISAVTEACNAEKDAPFDRPDAERIAWAGGYTDACDSLRAALAGTTTESGE